MKHCYIDLQRGTSRKEAKLILKCMREIIDRYGYVTLADLYDLIDIRAKYTDIRKGWSSLQTAKVKWSFQGYKLKLPQIAYIDVSEYM